MFGQSYIHFTSNSQNPKKGTDLKKFVMHHTYWKL